MSYNIFWGGIMPFYYTTDMKTTAIIYITMITVSVENVTMSYFRHVQRF